MYHQAGGIKLPAASMADRKIAVASKGHCTAYTVLGDDEGYRVQAESHLELCNLLMLNARQDVERLKEQALFVWSDNGCDRRHYFDVLAFFKCGRRIAFTVKPEIRIRSGRFLDEMHEITKHAVDEDFCDEVRLVTEKDINHIDQRNAMLFAAVRRPDPEADEVAQAVAAALRGAVSLRELTIRTGLAARGYRSLIRLLRTGELVPSAHEVITPKSLVQLPEVTR